MKRTCIVLSLTVLFLAGNALSQSTTVKQNGGTPAASVGNSTGSTPGAQSSNGKVAGDKKPQFSVYHEGPWEEQIGYSQAVRAGHTIYISGTVGANEKGFPPEMESQMQLAYATIRKTMSHYGADFSNVVMERIYTTDMESLIKSQEARKKIYGDWLPAATWVEVKHLYAPEAKLEIEVEVVLN
jgi:enamine deaminase RidA (YjgF/YER057c/UK114 family)